MISYLPLKKTMKEKSTSLKKLSELSGISITSLSLIINGNVSAQSDSLSKICSALKCNISDVIEFKNELPKQKEEKVLVNMNWEAFERNLGPNTCRGVALKIGKNENFLRLKKRDGKLISLNDVSKIAQVLGCSSEELIKEFICE